MIPRGVLGGHKDPLGIYPIHRGISPLPLEKISRPILLYYVNFAQQSR